MNTNYFQNVWENLIGKVGDRPLESRIFHATCVLSVITLIAAVAFNFVIGLYVLGLITLSICILVLIFFLYSRYKTKSPITILLYGILSNVVFGINFFFNSGIDGPSLLLFLASLFLITTVTPPRQFLLWILINITVVTILFIVQYTQGELISPYPSKGSRYLDLIVSYIIVVFLIFSVIKYIRSCYNVEKQAVEQKANELEISNGTKNKLLSIFAHDLRAPLDSIQSYLELLSATHLTNEEKRFIEKDLLEKTQNTGQMLANILSWTRAQMDGVNVNLTTLNLSESLDAIIKIQSTIAEEKGITIISQLDCTTELLADLDMLQLVVRNLLNNAIKFSYPGDQIHIYNKIENTNVIIAIKDSGIGINQQHRSDLFSIKGKSTYGTKKEKGIGLGLVLCKEFTELQMGKISFEDNPTGGTIFNLCFPFIPKKIISASDSSYSNKKELF